MTRLFQTGHTSFPIVPQRGRRLLSSLMILLLLAPAAMGQSESRPKTEDLLPENTVLYVQIEDIRDMIEKMTDSNFGQMLSDERISPLISEMYQQGMDAYSNVEDFVGLSMEEIQSLPSGEMCFAVVAPKRQEPAIVFLVDMDPENEAVTKAVDRFKEFVEEQAFQEGFEGSAIEEEETDEIVFETINTQDDPVYMFRKDGTVVGSNNEQVLKDVWERWNDRPVDNVRTLAENRKFVTIMNRCRGTKESPPEFRVFVDPIEFARATTRGNFAAQAALNFLPILGLDGLLGVGGSALFGEQDFESVFHGHVLLSNPRKGLFEMLALKPADYQPQSWVPHDTVNYMTTSWDVQTMYAELEKIVDAFSSDGSFQENVQSRINDELGIDLKLDVIDQMTGRVTYAQWNVLPARVNSIANIFSLEVSDPAKAEEMIDFFVERIRQDAGDEVMVEDDYKGQVYWKQSDSSVNERMDRRRQWQEERGGISMEVRPTQGCFMLLNDQLVICDSVQALERVVDTDRGDELAMADDEMFQMITNKMTRLLGTDMPAALFYSRPAETLKMWMEIAESENTRDMMDEAALDNPFVAGMKRAMDDNPLPDFEEIKGYFPPQGAFITDDETGYHFLAFSLKSEDVAVDSDE
ncbi:MAG: hypothetical protein VYE64_12485 [Planctomycetota bacterium]|nr:hypothetical protein [Planctomycetota bacterium]